MPDVLDWAPEAPSFVFMVGMLLVAPPHRGALAAKV